LGQGEGSKKNMLRETSTQTPIILTTTIIISLFVDCLPAKRNPLSLHELQNTEIRVPIHYLNADSEYAYLNAIYYYSGDSSEEILTTYFTTENAEGQTALLARMMTCRYCGQLAQPGEGEGKVEPSISWAKGEDVGVCDAYSDDLINPPITGEPFESCLYWLDEDLNDYKLYSMWSEDEAASFAESLSELIVDGQ
jgi:hypothetical protein